MMMWFNLRKYPKKLRWIFPSLTMSKLIPKVPIQKLLGKSRCLWLMICLKMPSNRRISVILKGLKKTIAQIKTYLETYFKIIVPGEELKKQYQQILDYEKQLEDMVGMSQMDYMMAQKTSRSSNYNLRKKKGI